MQSMRIKLSLLTGLGPCRSSLRITHGPVYQSTYGRSVKNQTDALLAQTMYLLGLTGSIGMGKSTVAKMFQRRGIPVFDADQAVHQLYKGAAVEAVEREFPGVAGSAGIDRQKLSRCVIGDKAAIQRLEQIVHPLVQQERQQFLQTAFHESVRLVVFDIPLLYETGAESQVDAVAVVSCSSEAQRQRVLLRAGMEPAKFEAILQRQTPDDQKRARADFVIDTGVPEQETEATVHDLIEMLQQRPGTKFKPQQ